MRDLSNIEPPKAAKCAQSCHILGYEVYRIEGVALLRRNSNLRTFDFSFQVCVWLRRLIS